jgi:hypothetical protein
VHAVPFFAVSEYRGSSPIRVGGADSSSLSGAETAAVERVLSSASRIQCHASDNVFSPFFLSIKGDDTLFLHDCQVCNHRLWADRQVLGYPSHKTRFLVEKIKYPLFVSVSVNVQKMGHYFLLHHGAARIL